MMRADLHLHTTASDGRLTPKELVRRAAELKLDVIAITDHDSVEGIQPALEEAKNHPQLTVIPGVEINTDVPKGEVHILGYFVNYRDPELKRALEELRNSRYERGRRMIDKLCVMNIKVNWNRVVELAGNGSVGRPHIAQAMQEQGFVSSLKEAFDIYIGRNCPAYVERKKLTPVEAVKLVLDAEGLPVLAHPADIESLELFIQKLKRAGIIGIETYYNGYDSSTIARLEKLAERHDLIASGGSDFHGIDDSIGASMGSVDIPRDSVEKLIRLSRQKGR
ncbi:MAG: PHP domain-containing protein [Chloroflexi bacterium]|nr:PHP domain-containing protein [Chloroflexota bacterium]